MPLEIYNTLSRSKQPLLPIVPGHVGLYVCGMTVYDYCHLGHARLFMAMEMAQRWMRALGLDVTYVRNITDVEDKIIRRAAENGETTTALTERMIRYMNEDFAGLGLAVPDAEPRATEYVPQMLGLIELLEKKGLAYQADNASQSSGTSATRWILCCGSTQNPRNRSGRRDTARADRGGTSSARQWRAKRWARRSTFMAAGRT